MPELERFLSVKAAEDLTNYRASLLGGLNILYLGQGYFPSYVKREGFERNVAVDPNLTCKVTSYEDHLGRVITSTHSGEFARQVLVRQQITARQIGKTDCHFFWAGNTCVEVQILNEQTREILYTGDLILRPLPTNIEDRECVEALVVVQNGGIYKRSTSDLWT